MMKLMQYSAVVKKEQAGQAQVAQAGAAARGEGSAACEKRRAASSSVVAAIGLTLGKGVVGLVTGSLGILAEAAHSALDLAAAFVTYLAVRVSDQPADREHTYGHGKIENMAALFETLLLLGTCVWIVSEAIERLFFKHVKVESSVWAFLVMGVSIAVDVSRARMLLRTARRYHSQALEADALHFSTDVWSSVVVLVGLVFVRLAAVWEIPWLANADAVAAMGVSAIVVYVSVQLGLRSVTALIDGIPGHLHEELMRAVNVSGVLEVRRARVRRSGATVFADVVLIVARHTTLERSHEIANMVEAAVQKILPDADVVVHVEPGGGASGGVLDTVRLLAERHELSAHNMRLYREGQRNRLELHVEADETLDVSGAHARVSAFEEELRKTIPEIEEVVSHIEPAFASDSRAESPDGYSQEEISRLVHELSRTQPVSCRAHDVVLRDTESGLHLSFHCSMSGQTSLALAHEVTDAFERALRRRLSHLMRVTIHVEPREEKI